MNYLIPFTFKERFHDIICMDGSVMEGVSGQIDYQIIVCLCKLIAVLCSWARNGLRECGYGAQDVHH